LLLFADRDAALSEYVLTAFELMNLKMIDAEGLESCAQNIGRRIKPGSLLDGSSADSGASQAQSDVEVNHR
jgi:hypothetical protein